MSSQLVNSLNISLIEEFSTISWQGRIWHSSRKMWYFIFWPTQKTEQSKDDCFVCCNPRRWESTPAFKDSVLSRRTSSLSYNVRTVSVCWFSLCFSWRGRDIRYRGINDARGMGESWDDDEDVFASVLAAACPHTDHHSVIFFPFAAEVGPRSSS